MINKNKKILEGIYNTQTEDTRLTRSRHGQLEYFTTMHYIHKYLKPNAKILEIGAGTGAYSVALAKEGYNVVAVELISANVKVLKQNAKGIKNIKTYQGDALDLSRFENESFDMVLSLGPMYHLYTKEEQHCAIDQALRVCKKDGVAMFAFLPVHSLIYGWAMEDNNMEQGIKENWDENYKLRQFKEQGFTGFEIKDFKNLFKGKNFKPLHMVATDSIMDIEEDRKNFSLTDAGFEAFKKYHLHFAEDASIVGMSFHALYVGKKL